MALQRLKVGKVIKPVARLRDAHNKLVELIGMMKGYGGIVMKVTDGGIAISFNPIAAVIGPGGQTGGGGGSNADQLHYLDANTQIDIDGSGIKVTKLSNGNYCYIGNAGYFYVYNNVTGNLLTIDPALITHDMSIQTWAVCNSGTPASSLVLASAPF